MGIPVCNVPDYGTNDVADHAMALMLSLRRGITRFVDGLRQGNEAWHYRTGGNLERLTNQTFGIVGIGRIGTAAALRAKAFGMRVVGYDPYVPRGHEKAIGIERVWELEELLGQSDVVSLHTPLTPETRHLADAAFFAAMRPGATLINTARGGVLDVDALEAAMRAGKVGAAGLDVMPTEPAQPGSFAPAGVARRRGMARREADRDAALRLLQCAVVRGDAHQGGRDGARGARGAAPAKLRELLGAGPRRRRSTIPTTERFPWQRRTMHRPRP